MTATATVISITPTRLTRVVIVICPLCHRRHMHGWPYDQPDVGSRVADCRLGHYVVRAAS